MDTKGANTFPLYNVPPEPKNLIKVFPVLFHLSLLDKRKVGGDSSNRDIAIKNPIKVQFTV